MISKIDIIYKINCLQSLLTIQRLKRPSINYLQLCQIIQNNHSER